MLGLIESSCSLADKDTKVIGDVRKGIQPCMLLSFVRKPYSVASIVEKKTEKTQSSAGEFNMLGYVLCNNKMFNTFRRCT